MLARALIAAAMIVGAGIYAKGAGSPERAPARETLATTPITVENWRGVDTALDDDVVAQLGVDDYINRRYVAATAAGAAAVPPVSVYVGYYASQRQGDTIHSPQNCLPGAGWRPVTADRSAIDLGGRTIPVNRFIIQKGMDRQAVFYWYQGRSRVVASELANKAWLMLDAARLRRTDGGLVRLMTPVSTSPADAFTTLTTFSSALFPSLSTRLP
jgi:EpsI family protein